MKQLRRLIPGNNTDSIPAVGTYIYIKSATSEVLVKTNKDESAFMSTGDFVRMDKQFTELSIEDLSGASNQITIVISDDGEAGKYGSDVTPPPGKIVTKPDVSTVAGVATLLIAANADRNEVFITPDAVARIGDSAINATRGTPIASGGTLVINTTGELYAFTAAIQTVAVMESNF